MQSVLFIRWVVVVACLMEVDCRAVVQSYFFFLSCQLFAQNESITIDQFLGVNWGWGDPLDKTQCVGFAREFHNWVDVQKDGQYSEPNAPSYPTIYPNECFYWNPASAGIEADYDIFYELLNSYGLGLVPAMKGTTQHYAI